MGQSQRLICQIVPFLYMSYVKTVLLGFLGGATFLFLFLSLFGSSRLVFSLMKSDLAGLTDETMVPTPTPISVVLPDFWQKIASDHDLSTVGIQSFKATKIIREGSGMVVSSDGLIVTTLDVVSGSDVFQVFYKDKLLRARLVKYDGFKNLALLKVGITNMDVARFDRNYQFQPGQDVVMSGKIVELSRPTVFIQKGMVSHIFSKDIFLNAEPNYYISGSKVVNNSGKVVGITYLRGDTVRLIKAETIDDFIKKYFESISQ